MNYFLLLIILGICGGGYYEYTAIQTQNAADQQVLKLDLQAKIDKLEEEKKALADANDKLTKLEQDDRTQILQLIESAAAAQKAQDAAKNPANATSPAAITTSGTPTASNNLGNIVTIDGKTYPSSELLKVDPVGITINCATGITKVNFPLMPPELQKRFGFDPLQGPTLSEAQAALQEQQCRAATGK